jgi:hypothetical protein
VMQRLNELLSNLPAAARVAVDALVPFAGMRHLFAGPEGVSGSGDGTAPTPPPGATPRRPGRRGTTPLIQPGIPAANLAASLAGQPVMVPASRSVPAPGAAGGSTTITTRVEGDRNTFHINGSDPVAMRRELDRLMTDRERRRNAERSPREPTT